MIINRNNNVPLLQYDKAAFAYHLIGYNTEMWLTNIVFNVSVNEPNSGIFILCKNIKK